MDVGVERAASIFGTHIFSKAEMKARLPEAVYKRLMAAVEGGGKLDIDIADYVAAAMKDWALSLGATHYAHWFQPRTEVTAERHLAFLSIDKDGSPIQQFSGKELVQSEPDASSFPSGGMRGTFEARGYCIWDPSSPAFFIDSHKGGTLCIPSVFLSYDGTPLDIKTPLLKSIGAVQGRALKLLKLFGNRGVKSVDVTIGPEQEYFLVDEHKAKLRPDLQVCRRTLIGAPSPKPQTFEAHYFGSIPPRVLRFMEDVERDAERLGQVLMTRHNEVAPGQFEFAPVLAEANVGCDQNQQLMEIMRKMARRHHFELLLSEKPFAPINGSGKHLNFSLRDSEGRNLLKPTNNPRRNVQFLSFMSAFLWGLSDQGGLLRAAVASPGNAHRLGGHEAPPAIISAYVGALVNSALENISKGVSVLNSKTAVDLGLDRLPLLEQDASDRNRTSPVAFTGNKWEFRAVGAPQALGVPLALLLAVWSYGLDKFNASLEAKMAEAPEADVAELALKVIKEAVDASANVRFEGNGYDPAWIEEAKRRGLPVCRNTVEALDQFLDPAHIALLEDLGIMNKREILAYREVRLEQFVEAEETEIGVLRNMMFEGVLPAISKQLIREKKAMEGLEGVDLSGWKQGILRLAELKCGILADIREMDAAFEAGKKKDMHAFALDVSDILMPIMDRIRAKSDEAESLIAGDLWPYPTYTELLKIDDFAE